MQMLQISGELGALSSSDSITTSRSAIIYLAKPQQGGCAVMCPRVKVVVPPLENEDWSERRPRGGAAIGFSLPSLSTISNKGGFSFVFMSLSDAGISRGYSLDVWRMKEAKPGSTLERGWIGMAPVGGGVVHCRVPSSRGWIHGAVDCIVMKRVIGREALP